MHNGKHNSFLKYFPTPKFLKMPAVGIDVTPEAVRFLELIETGSGFKVGRYGSYALPPAAADEENFLGGVELKQIVADIKARYKLNLITATLPEEKTYIFRTSVPKLSPRDTYENLELKLEEYVPLPPKEAVFDYQVIDGGRPDRVSVSVSVVPRLIVSRYLDFFQSLGLVPVSFQVSAQAASQALLRKGDHTPSIVVNFGVYKTSIAIVANRQVYFTSIVLVGGSSLTEAIRKYFSVSTAEAEKIKQERGVTMNKKDTDLFFSMASTLSVLKDEIEKLIAYWGTHLEKELDTTRHIEQVLLCGSEAGLPGLTDYLEVSLRVPVLLADTWTNVTSFNSYIPPIPRKDSLAYAPVIGLSLDHLC